MKTQCSFSYFIASGSRRDVATREAGGLGFLAMQLVYQISEAHDHARLVVPCACLERRLRQDERNG